jgi:hypothetical protein
VLGRHAPLLAPASWLRVVLTAEDSPGRGRNLTQSALSAGVQGGLTVEDVRVGPANGLLRLRAATWQGLAVSLPLPRARAT